MHMAPQVQAGRRRGAFAVLYFQCESDARDTTSLPLKRVADDSASEASQASKLVHRGGPDAQDGAGSPGNQASVSHDSRLLSWKNMAMWQEIDLGGLERAIKAAQRGSMATDAARPSVQQRASALLSATAVRLAYHRGSGLVLADGHHRHQLGGPDLRRFGARRTRGVPSRRQAGQSLSAGVVPSAGRAHVRPLPRGLGQGDAAAQPDECHRGADVDRELRPRQPRPV